MYDNSREGLSLPAVSCFPQFAQRVRKHLLFLIQVKHGSFGYIAEAVQKGLKFTKAKKPRNTAQEGEAGVF